MTAKELEAKNKARKLLKENERLYKEISDLKKDKSKLKKEYRLLKVICDKVKTENGKLHEYTRKLNKNEATD